MDTTKGLRAAVLAIIAVTMFACTDPAAGASPSAEAPEASAPAPATTDAPTDAPSAPSGPDDYEY